MGPHLAKGALTLFYYVFIRKNNIKRQIYANLPIDFYSHFSDILKTLIMYLNYVPKNVVSI